MPHPSDLVGQVLNGRFVIESELKRGGMGVVYLARDKQLHSRPVVVKVLLDEAYQSEYVVQKFRQEVEALSRIDHPGIVGIIDAGELPNGRPYIVMQYVEGVTLRSVMSVEGMNLERTAELLRQVGRALAAAHGRGILHRDLKPDNIMLQDLGSGEEQVKIIDFGIAKVKDSVVAPSTSLNLSPGTVAYMAPEQLNGRPITPATDIFALGTIAYEMVTGRKPFNPETGFELLQMQQSGVRVKPGDLRPSLPEEAEGVILKALAYDPSERYQDPKEFADQFARNIAPRDAAENSARSNVNVIPPTQLSNEQTPLSPGATPARTMAVAFQAAPPINPSATALGFGGKRSATRSSKRGLLIAVAGLFIVAAAVLGIWYLVSSRPAATEEGTKSTPAPAERNLSYWLTVQKMRGGRPYQDEFESSGQEIFENDWKFRLQMSSPQAGNLYLLNEGPAAEDKVTYNVLFPAPSANSGSPFVAANQKIQTGWMVFDKHQGTENFWMIWSANPVPELEAVKGVVNPTDKGEIKDAGQAQAVRDFLKQHSEPRPDTEKDKNKKQTNVKAKGDVMVHRIELEHH